MNSKIFIISIFFVFLVLLWTMSPYVNSGDSGEFITNSIILGINHSPGYPLYSLIGKIFSVLVPYGNYAYKINFMNIVFVLFIILFMYYFIIRCNNEKTNIIICLVLLLVFIFSESFWRNAVQTEVFVLNVLFAALIFNFLIIERSIIRWYYIFFIFALGLGNHHTLIFLFPGIFYFFITDYKIIKSKILLIIIFFILGFSVYLFLPIRALKQPALNWGEINSFSNFYNVITRKDYGTFQLTVDKPLKRDFKNTYNQIKRYIKKTIKDLSWIVVLLYIFSIFFLIKKELNNAIFLMLNLFFCGLGFILFSNLSFDQISDGILERFYILPNFIIVTTIFMGIKYLYKYKFFIVSLTIIVFVLNLKTNYTKCNYRDYYLNYDYGINILRTLPQNSILFMDGGDDTFYTLAYMQFVERRRKDVLLHDRGGLVFRNIYGTDFRNLSKEEKNFRREQVEKSFYNIRPVYYSTFNKKIFPSVTLVRSGILYSYYTKKYGDINNELLNEIYSLRYINIDYPDYRSNALVPIYYFMQSLDTNDIEKSYFLLKYCITRWSYVDWLRNNVLTELHNIAYKNYTENNYNRSVEVYNIILKYNPEDEYAILNLGVSYEKLLLYDLAKQQYEKVILLNNKNVSAYYNMAVLYWYEKDWNNSIKYFNEVLKIQPDNELVKKYLLEAQKKI